MKCLFCGCENSKVLDSRSTEETNSIRRRRECLGCGKRFTTYETIETTPILVVKNDGSRQPFDIMKIKSGIIKACEKRPVPFQTLESIANEIEQTLQNQMDREVTSTRIGELVMERLKQVDEVAYVRFASVYRQFKDISTFMSELNKLLAEK